MQAGTSGDELVSMRGQFGDMANGRKSPERSGFWGRFRKAGTFAVSPVPDCQMSPHLAETPQKARNHQGFGGFRGVPTLSPHAHQSVPMCPRFWRVS